MRVLLLVVILSSVVSAQPPDEDVKRTPPKEATTVLDVHGGVDGADLVAPSEVRTSLVVGETPGWIRFDGIGEGFTTLPTRITIPWRAPDEQVLCLDRDCRALGTWRAQQQGPARLVPATEILTVPSPVSTAVPLWVGFERWTNLPPPELPGDASGAIPAYWPALVRLGTVLPDAAQLCLQITATVEVCHTLGEWRAS